MAKAKRETNGKKKATPYTRNSQAAKNHKVKGTGNVPLNKKPITKSEKIRNADLTANLDDLMGDLTAELTTKKSKKQLVKKNSDTMEDLSTLEEEQLKYEKTQNDLDAALGLLTKL